MLYDHQSCISFALFSYATFYYASAIVTFASSTITSNALRTCSSVVSAAPTANLTQNTPLAPSA
ncbi:hypothetical protein B0H13DRAFT_2311460 [Mycena leptocephala]|nr:hypothetical protein B0H13DRAFT_2311460 [Mycena leptocephala]